MYTRIVYIYIGVYTYSTNEINVSLCAHDARKERGIILGKHEKPPPPPLIT